MSRIRVLPDQLVNQIAAGEVVERPASVVKELMENALDAGAREITIDVEAGGRRRIRVADDGHGLDRDDALLALERHATSKITDAADLGRIATLGFRGEALPAIAAVSRMTIQSSCDGTIGTRVDIEGGRILKVADAGHPRGTTIDVRDLFFNTPARAKFLKSPATEAGHIVDLVSAYAVAIPGVRVNLRSEGRARIDAAPAGDTRDRIGQIFGASWDRAIRFEGGRGSTRAHGLIAPPSSESTSRRQQCIYVNGRLIRDRLISHAIMAACEGFLPKGRHAPLFLFIECPAGLVDVNVHPAKAEVRFADGRMVHDLVAGAILGALRDALPVTPLRPPAAADDPRGQAMAIGGGWVPERGAGVHEAVQRYLDRTDGGRIAPGSSRRAAERRAEAPAAGTAAPLPGMATGPVALAHYRESYIVAADEHGLLLVDQHAAHERILYEGLLAPDGKAPAVECQSLLFPATVTVPHSLSERLEEIAGRLDPLGFSCEPFGEATLVVRAAPAVLGPVGPTAVIGDLLDEIVGCEDDAPGSPPQLQRMLATIACHAAVKVRMPLTVEKMNYLIKELFRTSAPLKCPHGRPAVLRFSHESIEQGFDRR